MTESMSQTQLVEDTNRFGKHKGSSHHTTNKTVPANATNGNHSNRNGNNNNSSNSNTLRPSLNGAASHIYTVVLQPYSSQFPVKTLEIKENAKCRIGRQSSVKTIPKPLNGYFDSKVLSRNHALLWSGSEGGIWIKDTKSSNGTFLNGHRLSAELEESEPFELKTGDQIEFGIDITGEDGAVLYHKVACSIYIYNLPVDEMDHATLKQFNLPIGYTSLFTSPDMEASQQRRGSASSVSTLSYQTGKNTITEHSSNSSLNTVAKRSKNWEVLLAKLESELKRSQQVEKELLDMKECVGDIGKLYNEDQLRKANTLNESLQNQLTVANQQIATYAEKARLQDLAMSSAQKQLLEMRQSIEKSRKSGVFMNTSDVTKLRQQMEEIRLQLDEEKLKHSKELTAEKNKCIEYEKRCLALERHLLLLEQERKGKPSSPSIRCSELPTARSSISSESGFFSGLMDALQIRSVQIIVGVMMAVISTLLYTILVII